MVDMRKRKKRIIMLSIIIIGFYIYLSAGVFGAYLEGITLIPIIERLTYMNSFSSGVAQLFSLLIVPATTIILLKTKEIDLEKSFLISRILVSISVLVILINLLFLNFAYFVWAISYSTDVRVWGPFFGYTLTYLLIFLLSLAVWILMRVKLGTKKHN